MIKWLTDNQILVSVVAGWAAAQILKSLIYMRLEGGFRAERLIGSGGMPSSHSATVMALVVAAFARYGIQSFEFAVSLVLAIIVMHDAMGVRLETGKQAKILNAMLEEDIFNEKEEDIFNMQLKELVGHTPLQVLCGGVLGIVVASFIQALIFVPG